ncbi:MAG TPA: polysaccharide deacetylase family protein [Xanthobacteraceae bacterium]|jgi:peptidoglycan/xylan/chitin deacetylase (PgdA/CDA1 family)|nr:polysaccharide deacetylase family protein [Xanthobacteraceae bacterium]
MFVELFRAATARRALCYGVVCLPLIAFAAPASAEQCHGVANALGTARTMALDPAVFPRVGTLQYPQTVPLRDHEVVLSFDDGPWPASTPQVLDALAAQCVKANFFLVGEHAKAAPELVRREYEEGHTVGTHSQTHADLAKLPLADAEKEIQGGFAAANAALGEPLAAPFFRAPYLSTSPALEQYLAKAGLMLWSIDADPEDWRDLTPDDVVSRAMTALDKKHQGIMLMHDVQGHTAAALPKFLEALKTEGYSVVHVIYGSAKEATARPQ